MKRHPLILSSPSCRDIKPANLLLHSSGHLKLCDFGAAARFSEYDEDHVLHLYGTDSTFGLPRSAASSSSASTAAPRKIRRLHRFYCRKPTGTSDYAAPEILFHYEQQTIVRLQKQADLAGGSAASACQESTESFCGPSDSVEQSEELGVSQSEDAEAMLEALADGCDVIPPEGPGPYGPECDWYSVGALLHEMAYGTLPMQANDMAITYHNIKNKLGDLLEIDTSVVVSEEFRDLLRTLVTVPDRRLGRNSTLEVKQHPFFAGVNWDEHYKIPPPFVPTVGATARNGPSSFQEPSVLHSPRPGADMSYNSSVDQSSFDFAAQFEGGPTSFRTFRIRSISRTGISPSGTSRQDL